MNIPLIIIYIFAGIGLLISSNRHKKPRSNENFWSTLIAIILHLLLIWWALGWRFW